MNAVRVERIDDDDAVNGVPLVGIEIHEPYFDRACRRIEAAQRQADLFVTQPVERSAIRQALL